VFAYIFITSAGCLAVNSISVAKQEREVYKRPIATWEKMPPSNFISCVEMTVFTF